MVILGDMNVGKTSLLHRYTERSFKDTLSTVGGAFFLKQWGPYHISIWDTAGMGPWYLKSGIQFLIDLSTLIAALTMELMGHLRWIKEVIISLTTYLGVFWCWKGPATN